MIPDLPTLMQFGAFLPRTLRPAPVASGDLETAVFAAVRDALADAPAPVAIALSGGVDSAVVAAAAREFAGPGLRAYTLDTGRAAAEASDIARRLNLPLDVLPLPDGVRVTSPLEVAQALGCPTHSAAPFGFLALYKGLAERGVATVLTGDGADEAFAGHAYHRAPPQNWGELWSTWRSHRALGMRPEEWLSDGVKWLPDWTTSDAARQVAEEARALPAPERLRWLDVRLRMHPQCVDLQAALTAHCGLSYRAPLADPRVVSAALMHPVHFDLPKAPLRALAAKLVGVPAQQQPEKEPMHTPTGRLPLDESWMQWLEPARVTAAGLFQADAVARAVEAWDPTAQYIPRPLVVAATTHAWLELPA